MAIFNSYVKLPEGIQKHTAIGLKIMRHSGGIDRQKPYPLVGMGLAQKTKKFNTKIDPNQDLEGNSRLGPSVNGLYYNYGFIPIHTSVHY